MKRHTVEAPNNPDDGEQPLDCTPSVARQKSMQLVKERYQSWGRGRPDATTMGQDNAAS